MFAVLLRVFFGFVERGIAASALAVPFVSIHAVAPRRAARAGAERGGVERRRFRAPRRPPGAARRCRRAVSFLSVRHIQSRLSCTAASSVQSADWYAAEHRRCIVGIVVAAVLRHRVTAPTARTTGRCALNLAIGSIASSPVAVRLPTSDCKAVSEAPPDRRRRRLDNAGRPCTPPCCFYLARARSCVVRLAGVVDPATTMRS